MKNDLTSGNSCTTKTIINVAYIGNKTKTGPLYRLVCPPSVLHTGGTSREIGVTITGT